MYFLPRTLTQLYFSCGTYLKSWGAQDTVIKSHKNIVSSFLLPLECLHLIVGNALGVVVEMGHGQNGRKSVAVHVDIRRII
jgi:hypothetical protein